MTTTATESLPPGDTDTIKAALAVRIRERILESGLKQYEAAALIGADPPRVSAIVNGELGQFGVYRLMRYLAALGSAVEVVMQPRGANAAVCVRMSLGREE